MGWNVARSNVTNLVMHMVDESFEWDESVIRMLPNAEALTLIAAENGPLIGYPIDADTRMEDLYVQTLPGDISLSCSSNTLRSSPLLPQFDCISLRPAEGSAVLVAVQNFLEFTVLVI